MTILEKAVVAFCVVALAATVYIRWHFIVKFW